MPFLIYNPDTDNSQTFALRPGFNSIGRDHENDIALSDTGRSVSRRHAQIELLDDQATVRDLGSSNHTFVNGEQVEQRTLQDGDLVRFGQVVCKFVWDLPAPIETQSVATRENFSIVRRMSPGMSQLGMLDLLEQVEPGGTMLKLRQQNDAQRTTDKLKILLEVSKQLSTPGSLDTLLEKILNLLFEIMTVDRALILLVDETTGRLEPKAVKSRSGGIQAEDLRYSTQIADFVLQHGDAILTNDAWSDQRFDANESIVALEIQASMCAPLQIGSATLGVLYVHSRSRSCSFMEEDLDFLAAMANQAAIAIHNTHLTQQMQSEAVMRAKLERFFPKAVSQKIQREEDLKIVETEITALFSDITGFTQMAAHMEPRQVLELLNEYFTVMVEDIVFRYAGTLEKYIADALLAVWGSPYRQPDDAVRAVQAAIEMQEAMQRLNRQRNLQWQIHIGLNTGKVAAGNIGSRQLIQYTHIGDTMNVASRICSAAEAGQILISQATLDSLGSWQLPVVALPPTHVKGKDEPLQLYRVLWQELHSSTTSQER